MEIAEITEYINRGLPIWPWIATAALCGVGIGRGMGMRKQIALLALKEGEVATSQPVEIAVAQPLVATKEPLVATPAPPSKAKETKQKEAKPKRSHDYREYDEDENPMRPARENELSVRAMIETQNRFKLMEQKLGTVQQQQEKQVEALESQKREAEKKEAYYQELLSKQSTQITEQTQRLHEREAQIREREAQINEKQLTLIRLEEEREEMQKKLRRFITTSTLGTAAPTPTPIGNITVATNTARQAEQSRQSEPHRQSEIDRQTEPSSTPRAIPEIAPITMAAPPDLPSFDTLLQSARWTTSANVVIPESQGNDDLTAIPGVGPAIANMLHNMGITTYKEIGLWTPEKLQEIDTKLDFQGRIEREKWVEHARRLHEKKYGAPYLAR
jgi:predicted flap endonuclease-1-like 5' DNA nuclease